MWCVLQVKTGKELVVKDRLKEIGYIALVPRENRVQRKDGGWTTKEYVLFPSYVFIELAYTAENYYRIKEIPTVIRFLGGGFYPDTLSYLEVEWIKLLANGGQPIAPTKVRLSADGEIFAVDGVLAAFKGRIKKVDRHKRKATFEITVCGEMRELALSIDIEGLNDI